MIAKQIERNGVFTALGFLLGAVNVLLLYTRVFTPEHYGTISFILASASLLFPFLSLGMQQTILRFFEGGDDENRKQLASLSLQLVSMFSVLLIAIVVHQKEEHHCRSEPEPEGCPRAQSDLLALKWASPDRALYRTMIERVE